MLSEHMNIAYSAGTLLWKSVVSHTCIKSSQRLTFMQLKREFSRIFLYISGFLHLLPGKSLFFFCGSAVVFGSQTLCTWPTNNSGLLHTATQQITWKRMHQISQRVFPPCHAVFYMHTERSSLVAGLAAKQLLFCVWRVRIYVNMSNAWPATSL